MSLSSSSLKTVVSLVDAVASKTPQRLALVSAPFFQPDGFSINQNPSSSPLSSSSLSPPSTTSWTYQDLSQASQSLAVWLRRYGYAQHDILMTASGDLPNVAEHLILQLACNRLGVGFATAKSLEQMSKFAKVRGAVVVDPKAAAMAQGGKGGGASSQFLVDTNLPLPYIDGEFLVDLIRNGGGGDDNSTTTRKDSSSPAEALWDDDGGDEEAGSDLLDCGDASTGHGFFNTPDAPYTNQQALQHGQEAAEELAMTENDVVCVSITLCHPFGIGSAVCSTFARGATLVLPPAVSAGGAIGCGVPSQRAVATLETLQSQECSLLFCDTHTLKALNSGGDDNEGGSIISTIDLPHLRGGVCKTGSGSTFLKETVDFGGTKLRTIGKAS